MALYFRNSVLAVFGFLFPFIAYASISEAQPDGWQFESFRGKYDVLQSSGDCFIPAATVKVEKVGSAETNSIGFISTFTTERSIWISLRTESYETCSSDYGQPCNGSAPDIWTHSSLAGDGVNNAVFRKREKNFASEESNLVLELVRTSEDRVALKYNRCFMDLVRN